MVSTKRTNSLAALMIALGLSTGFVASPVFGQAAQGAIASQQAGSTPSASGTPACISDDEEDSGPDHQDENETQQGGNDATAEAATTAGGTSENGNQDAEDSEGSSDSEDTGNDQQETNDTEDAAAAPGSLEEGQDLLSKATIPLDQAISTAQKEVQGKLGTVSLSDEDGSLVYSVEIGDQEVKIDAADGSVITVESASDNQENDSADNCDEQDADATPGAVVVDGQEAVVNATTDPDA